MSRFLNNLIVMVMAAAAALGAAGAIAGGPGENGAGFTAARVDAAGLVIASSAVTESQGTQTVNLTDSTASGDSRDEALRNDLPELAQVRVALDEHPAVRAAQAGLALAAANRDRLVTGSHEFVVHGDAARRTVGGAGGEGAAGYGDWTLAIERSLRLPAKARIDAALGEGELRLAQLALGDARHEAARELLDGWVGWLGEQAQLQLWQRQSELAAKLTEITVRRLSHGDASRMELQMAQAVQAQVDAQREQARARAQTAFADLRSRFPGLRVRSAIGLVTPSPLSGDPKTWQQRVLDESHALMHAQALAARAQLEASREQAERTPDPSIGVRMTSERSGAERIAGVFVSMPLSGNYRAAGARAASARAEIAERQVRAVERGLLARTAAAQAQLAGSLRAWLAAHDAAQRLEKTAALSQRAYELGETALAEVLLARRVAADAELAQLKLMEQSVLSRYRLLLDAHMLWPLDDDSALSVEGVRR
jgi:cobalt-zinc-cadmium efflux system outer membrane protein